MKFQNAFVLSAVFALIALPFAGPLSDWMYAHFEFVRYHPVIVNASAIEPIKPMTFVAPDPARVAQDTGIGN